MKAHDLNAEINRNLNEINSKIIRLKKFLKEDQTNSDLKETVADLEDIRDDIIHQYNVINSLKMSAEEKLKDLRNKIFASIRSFNKAYSESGGLIKTARMKERHHSIDFNNPSKTK